MIGTRLLKGQGLGNQLFCYITARSIAADKKVDFSILDGQVMTDTIADEDGKLFIDVDMGVKAVEEDFDTIYNEHEDRMYLPNSNHDIEHGAYITGVDEKVFEVSDKTLIQGNMQAEEYFSAHVSEMKEWFRVKPEYESNEYSRDNLCIINMRGGEYTGSPELFLNKRYWKNGIKHMRSIRPDMEFMIVTDDVATANKLLPGVEAHHFNVAKDFVTIKNAHYLLLSNSSFACIPAYISDKLEYALAPKYWARHNVSDGYWASEQNIYSIFHYMDRNGRIFDADACKEELKAYKATSARYKKVNIKPSALVKKIYKFRAFCYYKWAYVMVICRGIARRIKRVNG